MENNIDTNIYRVRFLEKYINKANYKKTEEVINNCIELAYKDMLSGGKRVKINNKEDIIKKYKNTLEKNNYKFDRILINECKYFLKKNDKNDDIIEIKDKNGKICKANTFGLAQKLVNMTFKYLLVYKNYIDKQIVFSNCDCPLDSNILKKVVDKEFINKHKYNKESDVKWTKLIEEEYLDLQDKIKELLKKDKYKKKELKELNCGNLAYDFAEFYSD